MEHLKELLLNGFCTFSGALFVLARFQGHPVVSNWLFLIWVVIMTAYFVVKSTKKEN